MLKPLSGLLNLALPTALRENDTGPEAGGMPFADVFASLDQEAPDSAEPDEGDLSARGAKQDLAKIQKNNFI